MPLPQIENLQCRRNFRTMKFKTRPEFSFSTLGMSVGICSNLILNGTFIPCTLVIKNEITYSFVASKFRET